MSGALLLAVALVAPPVSDPPPVQAAAAPRLAGRPLPDVLREFQRRGLRLVFSSEVVRPAMRVAGEPRSLDPRRALDEVLEPHGLEAREASRGLLLVVPRPPVAAPPAPSPLASIQGVVVDADSAAALPRVLIKIPASGQQAVTGDDGRFQIAGVGAGTHRLYVSLVGYALAEPDVTVDRGRSLELSIALSASGGSYSENVQVVADPFRAGEAAVPSTIVLNGTDLRELRGVLTDDPLRAVQSLPSVMAANDLRSEFSVRGSDVRHVGLTIDGLPIGWPVHTVRGDPGGGSVGLLNPDVLDGIGLLAGAYPQEQTARSGGWLELSVREGSRAKTQAHASLSLTAASLVTEGPLGARGSWLLSARQSFVQWIVKRLDSAGTSFGYSDLLGKVAFDLTPRQQVQVLAVAGRSLLEQQRTDPDPNTVIRGTADTGIVAVTWRSLAGPRVVLTQKAGYSGEGFANDTAPERDAARGTSRHVTYRADAALAAGSETTLRLGTEWRWQSADQSFVRQIGFAGTQRVRREERIDGTRSVASVFVRARTAHRGTILDGGLLAEHADDGLTASPWAGAAIPLLRQWTVRAGAGAYRQLPALDQVASSFAPGPLKPEWSRHVDVALERALGAGTRAQITWYHRDERDGLRLQGDEFRLSGTTVVAPSVTPIWQNSLSANATGVEALVQRRAVSGLMGWISYAYARTTYRDVFAGETFDGDYDQRHTFTAYGLVRRSPSTAFSGKLRIGGNFPLVGYLAGDGGELRIGAERNRVRLPAYVRLDLRADRAFNMDSRRLTLFAEIVNVFGRGNVAGSCACGGWVDAPAVLPNGRVVDATQKLFPFLPTVGLTFDF